ncbi:MAG: hypothetical protein PVH78_05495 [Deltaproteobacteria bacterium]|jgi:hypothetical protein
MFIGPSMENREKRGRTLEEVSHFFLSGERPSKQGEEPVGEQAAQADGEASTPMPVDLSRTETDQNAGPTAPIQENVCLLFSASKRLSDKKSFLACNLALELARQDFSVGLIETTARLPNTFFLFGGYKNINAVFWEKDLNSPDFLTILDRLRRANDFLVMNVSPDVFGPGKMTAAIHPFFVIPTTGHSEDLLNAYALIKQIARDGSCPDIGLVILGEDPLLPAEAMGEIMSAMAQKFLSCKIHFMGAIPDGADASQATLTKPPLLQASHDSPLSNSIKRLADNLIMKNNAHLKGAGNVEDNQ